MLDKALKKYNLSQLAKNLIHRLLARGISDRYRVYQALSHPWITFKHKETIPMTQNETNYQMDVEMRLKFVQNTIFSLVVSKYFKKIKKKIMSEEHNKKQTTTKATSLFHKLVQN